jgi:hypothetical protein
VKETSYNDFSHVFKNFNFDNMKPLSDHGYESDSMHSSSSGERCPPFLFFSFVIFPPHLLSSHLLSSLFPQFFSHH